MKKQSSRKSPRITRSHVRALIPLDTEKIRRSELGKFKRSQTTHSTLTAQLDQFEKEDVPAFRKWMHSHCGDLREKISAAYNECSTLQHTLLLAEELCDFYYPDRTRKECADAAVAFSKNNGEIPKGFEEFFEPEPVPEPDDGPFGFFEEDDEESEEARKFFESLLGDFSDAFGRPFHELPRFQHTAHQKANTAKKLYRSITKKLHPDRVGNTTPEQQELWHAAKRAYELDDVATLEHIEAHCELLNPHHNRLAAVSTIRSGILFYKKANTQIRRTLREMKFQPEWGFLSWSNQKKEALLKKITRELNADLRHLTACRAEIQHLLHQMQTPRKKQTRRKRSAVFRQDQDLFDFF